MRRELKKFLQDAQDYSGKLFLILQAIYKSPLLTSALIICYTVNIFVKLQEVL